MESSPDELVERNYGSGSTDWNPLSSDMSSTRTVGFCGISKLRSDEPSLPETAMMTYRSRSSDYGSHCQPSPVTLPSSSSNSSFGIAGLHSVAQAEQASEVFDNLSIASCRQVQDEQLGWNPVEDVMNRIKSKLRNRIGFPQKSKLDLHLLWIAEGIRRIYSSHRK